MGLIFEHFRRLAGARPGRSAERLIPVTEGDAIKALAVLAGWLAAAGLVLTGLVWLVSGAFAWAALPIALGVALGYSLARAARRPRR